MTRISSGTGFARLLFITFDIWLPSYKTPENGVSLSVTVDFGTAGKHLVKKEVILPVRSTAFEVSREAFPIVTSGRGGINHFVEALKGVRSDPKMNRWWYSNVNGYRSNVAAEKYLVKHGDKVQWLYLTVKRFPPTKSPQVAGRQGEV